MAVVRTFTSTVNVNVLSREVAAAGLNTGFTVDADGVTVTFLDTDDGAAVDAVITAYNSEMTDRTNIINALNANQNYLGVASPTNAQVVAQVKALTQQIDGLVKILNKRGVLD